MHGLVEMQTEPLFQFIDHANKHRTVRIVRNYLDNPDVIREAVADVQDVESGEMFQRIPIDKLRAS